MAIIAGTLWSEKTIYNGRPEVKSTATYQYERVGTQLKIKIDTANHCTRATNYWDWRWAFNVAINSKIIAQNIQIKPRTYLNTIGTTVYRASTGWATVDIGTATEVEITVTYYDTDYNDKSNKKVRLVMSSNNFKLGGISPLPTPTLGINTEYPNVTNTTARINYSVDIPYSYINLYLNGQQYGGNITTSPINLTGLKENTQYEAYAKAYGNGAFGNPSNTIKFKTYIKPSGVKSTSVGDILPFSATAYCNSDNVNNTPLYEYALCDINKNVVQGAYTTPNSYYNFTGLQEETSYYIRCRVKSGDSGAWSDYVYTPLFTTPADQTRSYIKSDGTWKQGKVFYKTNGEWKKIKKAYIKINGEWKLAKNKY